jgi:hypothetical protein
MSHNWIFLKPNCLNLDAILKAYTSASKSHKMSTSIQITTIVDNAIRTCKKSGPEGDKYFVLFVLLSDTPSGKK